MFSRAWYALIIMIHMFLHAWRAMVKAPLLAAVVIASLGVGIGVNTVVFSWVQRLLLQPLPGVADSIGFHHVEPRTDTGNYPGASWLEYLDLRERLHSFRDVVAFRMVPFNVGEADHMERTYGLLVSGNYFSALGLRPAAGRFFGIEETARPGAEPVAVISHDYWQTHFGGAPGVLGETIRVNEREMTIIGVAPAGFQGSVLALSFDVWVPATMAPVLVAGSPELTDRSLRGYSMIGRLRPGVTLATAQSDLDSAMVYLARVFPETNATMRGDVFPFWRAPHGPQRLLARALEILQGVMLLLLLTVCGNTANLMLARASARQREMGVRLALGAGPWRIAGLLLAENLLLALIGATLGAALAMWGTAALRAVPLISSFPIKVHTSVDGMGLAFAATLGLVCGLIVGVVPAMHLARIDPQIALRSGAGTPGRRRMRNVLMGVEVALALMVLVTAALFFQSFRETRGTDTGFRREGLMLAAYDLSGRNSTDVSRRVFAARLLQELRALPGVEAASIATNVPLDIHGMPMSAFTLEGRGQSGAAPDRALTNIVTPGYFQSMGIPLVAGDDFADLTDTAPPPQIIVNEEFVRRYIGNGQALGRRLQGRTRNYVIIGVARNSLYESFGEPLTPIVYFSYRDRSPSFGEVHIRTRPEAEMTITSGARQVVRDLDPTLLLYDVRTMNEHVEKNLFLRRIPAQMFVVLGPLLLMLAAIGIYAVVDYTVSQRITEVGVRLALGGTAQRVARELMRESLRVIAIGAAAGWLIAVVVFLHVMPGRPIALTVFAGVPAVLMAVATAACWWPARRAANNSPMAALRQE